MNSFYIRLEVEDRPTTHNIVIIYVSSTYSFVNFYNSLKVDVVI